MENCLTVLWIKNGLYIPAFFIALGFPEQTSWSITILTFLMVIDFITGIIASAKVDGIQSITSKRMTAGAVAKLIIILIPFIVLLTGKGLGLDSMKYVQGVLFILIVAEAYSNLGNIQSFRTGQRVPEIDAVSLLLKKIRKGLLELLDKAK